MMNRGRVIRGRVEYRVDYRILGEFLSKKSRIFTGTRLDPESNIGPLFGLLFDPK